MPANLITLALLDIFCDELAEVGWRRTVQRSHMSLAESQHCHFEPKPAS
jgi:hypothetical protein